MKVAFVSLYEAYPPASGAAYVTYNCARLTPGTNLLIQLAPQNSIEESPHLRIVSLRQREPSRLARLLGLPIFAMKIRKELYRFRPDCVVLEGASWVAYLAFIAMIIRRTLPALKIVYHAHNVEYDLRHERKNRLLTLVTRVAEKHLLTTCDRSFAVSSFDRQRFLALYGVQPALLPNGVECAAYSASQSEIDLIKTRFGITDEAILFMGLYQYPPNTEAVRFLIDQVVPALHRERPNLRLVVTGGGPPCSPPWLINTGIVTRRELSAVLSACRIGVAPIFRGSGTRLKILEYMAAGLPVVSTKKGAEGLGLDERKHVLFAETATEFQEALLRLLSDSSLSINLSTHAASFAKSNFDWIPILERFSKELKSL